ncbi:MAG: cytochrome c [Bacteroidia bacterium]|nr:cytochrome c [Bacteroidia bacterium]NNF30120.1 cytochrome c [Flavobacteriaceae bacterium]MBT8274998.1 cytochrome c [Bacteroidia bacterium]NNJ80581.1 cytochrome c [Flavobacteriaceae bacterium]NNK55516.1 cytochrome c [Flavobacteriaceae bacterium]
MKSILAIMALTILLSCNSNAKQRASVSSLKPDPKKELDASKERGGLIYTNFCIQCHMANGKGIPGTFPPLAGSDWLTNKRKESIHAVKYGQTGEIIVNGETYNSVMVSMGLSDEEIADVLNYVMNSWGNTQLKMVTASEVGEIQK